MFLLRNDRAVMALMIVAILAFLAAGCGETVRGAGKDIHRVGRGVKTIFISR